MHSGVKSCENLISLYSKIPDYSEVKHLGDSDFIKAIEQLKEEFRQCRASLSSEDSSISSDIDFISDRTSKVLNINRNTSRYEKISNTDLATSYDNKDGDDSKTYLSVRGCQLHRFVTGGVFGNSGNQSGGGGNYINYNKPSRSLSFNFEANQNQRQRHRSNGAGGGGTGTDSAFHEGYDFGDEDDEEENRRYRNDDDGLNSSDSEDSKWSSSPDLRGFREYVPPSNIEKRVLKRRVLNNSAPSLLPGEDERDTVFKANPVPSHVYKPLYEFIMLKNQRRSQKVREQSKQKLMAQVKPFSFTTDKSTSGYGIGQSNHKIQSNNFGRSQQTASAVSSGRDNNVLNNMKPIKSRRTCSSTNFKTVNHFKANPAPPRTKALMSAMKLKEQQEYRELKKRLRAEALLKNSTLPPSMALRDKRLKLCNAKLDALIENYHNSYKDIDNNNRCGRITYRDQQSTDVDVDTAFTDDDRLSEDSFGGVNRRGSNFTGLLINRHRRLKNFTPFGKSRHSSAASGVFECTSNDNLASRLRIQATRKRESERMKREEEELLKLMKNENRRKKLRDSHLQAWRRAHSYSSSQDIAMRRQLRMAASILERESFVRGMSTMLSRVRSAPLLLEGVRERKFDPCKKHREEFLQLSDRYSGGVNKPRFTHKSSSNWHFDRFGFGDEEKSETVALAEGSLTNSDNDDEDPGRNFDSDSEDEHEKEEMDNIGKNNGALNIAKDEQDEDNHKKEIRDNHENSRRDDNSGDNQ